MNWLLSLIVGPNSIFLILGGAIIAFFAHGARQRVVGRRLEREKQAAARQKAKTEADTIEDAIAGRDPGDNRERLKQKWSTKR